MSFVRILWESLNEIMLIMGAVFIGFFFASPSLLNNYWIVYGVALVIVGVISRYGLEKVFE